jgi:hypothetical protein
MEARTRHRPKLGDLLVLSKPREPGRKRRTARVRRSADELRTLATLREQRETWRKAYPASTTGMRPLPRRRWKRWGRGRNLWARGIRKGSRARGGSASPGETPHQRLEDAGLPALNGLLASGTPNPIT